MRKRSIASLSIKRIIEDAGVSRGGSEGGEGGGGGGGRERVADLSALQEKGER